MELANIVDFYENKTILITGATGFLAKILVEKILRIQPNVKKLLLLFRTTDTKSGLQRLHDEVLGKELFRVIKESWGENANSHLLEKVIPISGDISFENLGIKDHNLREEMLKEIDIIVNSAATTRFDERYDVAMGINITGATNVLNFAKRCSKLQLLLHVSTAYVCGKGHGVIKEKPLEIGESLNGTSGLDIQGEKKLVQETLKTLLAEKDVTQKVITDKMKSLGIQRAKKYGWPNTYVFTKAMAEMAVGQMKENLPLVILRPTMITSTLKEPFPGWMEGLKTIDGVTISYGKGKIKCFLGDLQSIFDAIPGDIVVNSMMVAIAAHSNKSNFKIYQVGSSLRNPLKYEHIPKISYNYFTKNPWIDEKGKSVKIGKLTMLRTMGGFRMYMGIRYLLMLKVLRIANVILQKDHISSLYVKSSKKFNLAMRMADLYKPYLFFKGIFDDTNTENLRMAARENSVDEDLFNFDPTSFDWEDYFLNIHFPGIISHLTKK